MTDQSPQPQPPDTGPGPEPAKGWMTAEEIFGARTAARIPETILISQPVMSTRTGDFDVLATDTAWDFHVLQNISRGAPRSLPVAEPEDTHPNQLGLFHQHPGPPR